VWDHQPTADELLDRRLTNGWEPTPSLLKVGPTILGHAACRVRRDTSCHITDASA
jgi:hypothetical protein